VQQKNQISFEKKSAQKKFAKGICAAKNKTSFEKKKNRERIFGTKNAPKKINFLFRI
jgi:hypothetical protein